MIGIGMVLERDGWQFMGDGAVGCFDDLANIKILDRKVVVVELEDPTHRGKTGLAQRHPQLVLVPQVTTDSVYSLVDEQGRIVALGCIERGYTSVGLLKIG